MVYRDGDNEASIQVLKGVLAGMYKGKDNNYRAARLEALHKHNVITGWLGEEFDPDSTATHDYFGGIFRYKDNDDIIKDLKSGWVPISCARSKQSQTSFHIFSSDGQEGYVKCITVEMISPELYIQKSGMHFCQFRLEKKRDDESLVEIKKIYKTELEDMVDGYALLLPYRTSDNDFESKFTLVYSDWEVLRCDIGTKKGHPSMDNSFENI